MADILLMRHSTTNDVNNQLAGRIDTPLNEDGRQRAHALAVALSTQPIQAIYASPLQRTMQTAEPLADRLRLQVQPEDSLIQVNYGNWETRPFWELQQDPDWRRYVEEPSGQIPGGEHITDVVQRVSKGLKQIAADNPGDGMVLAVTHGSIIRFAIAHFLGMEPKCANRLKIYPGSVSVLRILQDDVGVLVSMNRLF